jgi:hypothetical protein
MGPVDRRPSWKSPSTAFGAQGDIVACHEPWNVTPLRRLRKIPTPTNPDPMGDAVVHHEWTTGVAGPDSVWKRMRGSPPLT